MTDTTVSPSRPSTTPPLTPGDVTRFADLRAADAGRAGGKGANLGELRGAGFPVPDGFVVLAGELRAALAAAGALEEVGRLHDAALDAASGSRVGTPEERLSGACRAVQDAVGRVGVPAGLAGAIGRELSRLGADLPVAVRSSAVGEDSAETSFAGMNATLTNVRGLSAVTAAVAECWASAFAPRSVAYREHHGDRALPAIAVVVQDCARRAVRRGVHRRPGHRPA